MGHSRSSSQFKMSHDLSLYLWFICFIQAFVKISGGHFPVRFSLGSKPNQTGTNRFLKTQTEHEPNFRTEPKYFGSVRFGSKIWFDLVWFGSHIFLYFTVLTKCLTAFYNFHLISLHFTIFTCILQNISSQQEK